MKLWFPFWVFWYKWNAVYFSTCFLKPLWFGQDPSVPGLQNLLFLSGIRTNLRDLNYASLKFWVMSGPESARVSISLLHITFLPSTVVHALGNINCVVAQHSNGQNVFLRVNTRTVQGIVSWCRGSPHFLWYYFCTAIPSYFPWWSKWMGAWKHLLFTRTPFFLFFFLRLGMSSWLYNWPLKNHNMLVWLRL